LFGIFPAGRKSLSWMLENSRVLSKSLDARILLKTPFERRRDADC
jgi:hypothetical protein